MILLIPHKIIARTRGVFALSAFALIVSFVLLTASPAPSTAASAPENYRFYCAQCHGLEGLGDGPNATKNQPVEPRDHTSAYEMGKLTDEDIGYVIRDGGVATSKSTLMPPFGATLTDEEIAELVVHIRKLCNCTVR
ncbi:MAG: cytochrome c [Proteobacteria bacterium]|nr:cytochrome c [Pseudomonadota bacterium]